MKVAVIGGGIAGNTAAYHLCQDHQVTLFEAADYLGGHTHTHDIEWAGKHYAVDTGFIVFNERTYPNFIHLLNTLGVEAQKTEMSFSVACENSGLEYNGHSLNTLFAQRRNLISPRFLSMVRDILRFNKQAPESLKSMDAEMPLGEYLAKHQYGQEFINHYIVPMGAAIWSTDPTQMQQFPARFFIRFFCHHGLLEIRNRPQWFVIKNGSKQYLDPLSAGYKESIRLSTPVVSVRRMEDCVQVESKQYGVESFDAIFIATHSDQALTLLQDASDAERSILSELRYQPNQAVLHTDPSVMPQSRRAWASWNYHLGTDLEHVTLTYDMNRLQSLNAPVGFFVTLNNSQLIDPKHVIKRIEYHHPLFTPAAILAQSRLPEINGINRTFYCGAYWANGFHEDGVVSANQAVEAFKQRYSA